MKTLVLRMTYLGAVLLFLYAELMVWRSGWAGGLGFAAFLAVSSTMWQDMFNRIFRMKRSHWLTALFSLLSSFFLLGLVSGIGVVWYTLTPFVVWLSYVVAGASTALLWVCSKWGYKEKSTGGSIGGQYADPESPVLWKGYHVFLLLYLVLWGAGLYLLFVGKSSDALLSPWQTISPYFLPLYFSLTALLGFLIFSKYKIKTLLMLVLLHSALLHLYLPLSHANPWGGDVWRHLAVEQQILDGGVELPVLAGPEARWREVFGVDLPEAIIIPHKYIYGHLWGTSILLAETLHIDLIAVNIWLVPILWSVFLPIIFFRMGNILFGSWRKGLWLAWLAAIPFPLQALGGLSLPVSLGYLLFFFTLMLWLQYLQDGRIWQRRIALLFGVLMLFGYTLHFILIWAVIGISFLVKQITDIRKQIVRNMFSVLLFTVSMFFFPVIELLGKTSRIPSSWNWIEQGKQLVGQFSGWYYASVIRPHDILSGNILFNHTPNFAFVSSVFTDWRWHVIPAALFFIAMAVAGLFMTWRRGGGKAAVLRGLGFVALGGYAIGWFFLEGDRSFVRRLDALVAFVLLIFFVYGVSAVLHRISNKKRRLTVAIFILFFSWFGTTSFASGPDMRVASTAEYKAAGYVWSRMDIGQDTACVLADTWVLLPLESISSGRVVGGGFPIDYQFGQSELAALFEEVKTRPSENTFSRAYELTGADVCWIVVKRAEIAEGGKDLLSGIIGAEPEETDSDVMIWRHILKEE